MITAFYTLICTPVKSFNRVSKSFTRLCTLCKLKDELKTFHNTLFALGYPGNLISKVITRAISSTALKMIGPQKYPIYLNLSLFGSVSEKYFENFWRSKIKGLSDNFSAIGKQLVNNQEWAQHFKKDQFLILVQGENPFQLHILENLYKQTLKPNLCKQKRYVCQMKLFRSIS